MEKSEKTLINLKTGMFNTSDYQLLSHDPKYCSTIQIPIAYDPDASCPRFTQFVHEVMDGDAERIAVLQELAGYLLVPENPIHKAFFLYGEGANGKSIFLEILTLVIGRENVSSLTIQDLDNSFRRFSLIGKMVNIASENEIDPKGFNSQYFKAIVSGDRIMAEKKHGDVLEFKPCVKMIYAVNNLPYSPDKAYGFFRRVCIIPFNRRFDGDKADCHLIDKLKLELPGILNWMLAGLKRLRNQEYCFTASSAIEKAVAVYKQDQNPIGEFMADRIVASEGRLQRSEILDTFDIWLQDNGLGGGNRWSRQTFWRGFEKNCKEMGLPYDKRKSNGVSYQYGLAMKKAVAPGGIDTEV